MTPPDRDHLLHVRDLRVEVETRNGPALAIDGLDFHVDKGETLGVVGESGSGKSLTMLSLVGLLPSSVRTTGGTIHFEGRDLRRLPARALRDLRGRGIGFIFQDPGTSLNPVMRIGDQIAEPLIHHLGLGEEEAEAKAIELLRLVGVPAPETRIRAWPHEFSGGMRQRVMIAMGLACNPPLLIADEPTTALDVTVQAQIVDLVKSLRARLGMAVIWITHDLALVAGLADRILVLYAGAIVEEAPVEALYADPLHPYTQGLLASLPRLGGERARRLPSIAGAPPELGGRPVGCAFTPRCSRAEPVCHSGQPRLLPVRGDGRHKVACFVAQAALST